MMTNLTKMKRPGLWSKKVREFLNGIGLVVAAVAMMAVGIGLIFLIHSAFHAFFK